MAIISVSNVDEVDVEHDLTPMVIAPSTASVVGRGTCGGGRLRCAAGVAVSLLALVGVVLIGVLATNDQARAFAACHIQNTVAGLPSALGGCGGNDELPGKPSVAGGGVVSTIAANIIELSIAKEAAVEAENFTEAQRLKLQIKELASKLGEQTEARGWHHNTTTTTFPEHSLYDDAGAAPLENASLYAALLKANIKAHSLETALKEALLQGKASEKSAAAATASAAAASAAAEAAAAKAAAAKAVATAETASKVVTRTSVVAAPRHQAVWNGWARPLATSVPQSDWLPPERVKNCLRNRWIYIIGDSSFRMFFKAFINQIDPTFEDPHFGSYKRHDKGGCGAGKAGDLETHADTGGGCLREYWNREANIRISFSFHTVATQKVMAVSQLTSPTQQPDLILLATGAWDCYGACDAAEAAIRAAIWTKSFTSQFPRALVAAATLSTCWIPFEPRAKAWNAKFQSLNLEADPRVAILDRAPLTPPTPPGNVHKTNGQVDCEGWHMYNGIAVQNTQSVLRGVCHGKLI